MKKKGISLIVLVITIVVIIILAAAVILSLGKNNPINDAKKAKIAQTVDNFKSDLSIQVADKLLKNPMITVDEIDSNETLEGFKITDLIPSIKGTEYEDDFKVVDGKLKLKEETTLPEETQNIIKEYLGEKVENGETGAPEQPETPTLETYTITYNLDGGTATNLTEYTVDTDTITLNNPIKAGYVFAGWTGSNGVTAQKTVTITKGSTGNKEYTANWRPEVIKKEVIEANPSFYVGKSVKYTGYSESTNVIDWRIFGIDKDGNVMLKAHDCIDLTYKIATYPSGIEKGYDDSNTSILSTADRTTFINYIGNKNNWKEYEISGKTTARGAMTLSEFVNGYNLVNSTKISIEYLTVGSTSSDGAFTAEYNGYVIKKGTESYSDSITGIIREYNGMSWAKQFNWIASESANGGMMNAGWTFITACAPYNNIGICPVVSITGGVLVEKADGTFAVE